MPTQDNKIEDINKVIDEAVRDLCSVEFRSKSKTREIVTTIYTKGQNKTLHNCWNEMSTMISEGDTAERVLKGWETRLQAQTHYKNKEK